jgi:hypothetical protein
VLNTLTEHDFQDALKKMAEPLETVHRNEVVYIKDDGGQLAQCYFSTSS